MRTEVFSEDGVVGFADFSSLETFGRAVSMCGYSEKIEKRRTMNLRSLENAKRITASIRSKGSSESLILQNLISFLSYG